MEQRREFLLTCHRAGCSSLIPPTYPNSLAAYKKWVPPSLDEATSNVVQVKPKVPLTPDDVTTMLEACGGIDVTVMDLAGRR